MEQAVLFARLDPDFSLDRTLQYLFQLADSYARSGQIEAAERLYDSLTLPQCGVVYRVRAHFAQADLMKQTQRAQQAIGHLRKVLEITTRQEDQDRAREELKALGVQP